MSFFKNKYVSIVYAIILGIIIYLVYLVWSFFSLSFNNVEIPYETFKELETIIINSDEETKEKQEVTEKQETKKKTNTENKTKSTEKTNSESKKKTTTQKNVENKKVSNNKTNTSEQKTKSIKETKTTEKAVQKEKTVWEKLGMSEDEYYNKPAKKWEVVNYSVSSYGSKSAAMSACENHGKNYKPYLDGEVLYTCHEVLSTSGKFLGIMFKTQKITN